MTPLPASLRYERKYLLAGLSLPEALTLVRRHPAVFREAYPPRYVNNLYFDSPGLQDFLDHVHGISHRKKHRVRWYGPVEGWVGAPVFEEKIKRGLVSGKVATPLPAFHVNGGGTRGVQEAILGSEGTAPAVRRLLRERQPALVNRYRRHYFVSGDGLIRLTVDSDLRFLAPSERGASRDGLVPRGTPVVLELKYAPADADRAAAVSNALPFRVARCSKYVLGIQCLKGTHPSEARRLSVGSPPGP